MQLRDIVSSHIAQIGHDSKSGDLHVVFRDGKHSVFSGVPAHIASNVMDAESIGKAFHAHVKGKFPHRYHGES